MSMENDGDTDNIELNKAIADSISSLKYQQDEHEKEDDKSDHADDIDLENAIGDVFNQFDFGDTQAKNEEDEQRAHEDKEDDDLELNKAIGNALGSMDVNKQQTSEVSQSTTDANAEVNASGSDDKESSSQNDDGLEEAIGNAFSSLEDKPEIHSDTNHKIPKDDEQKEDSYERTGGGLNEGEGEGENEEEEEEENDDDLEKAIRDAFESNQQTQNEGRTDSETHTENDSIIAAHVPPISMDSDKHDRIESERLDEVIDGAFSTLENSDHQRRTSAEPDNDEDLNRAIANAFSGITENNNSHDTSEKDDRDGDDLDLNEAIGNAFKNISELGGTNDGSKSESQIQTDANERQDDSYGKHVPDEVQRRGSRSEKLTNTINNVLDEFIPGKDENKGSSTKDDDLHDAISASFKQLMGEDDTKNDKEVSQVSHVSEAQQPSKDDKHDNMDAFMENVISEAFRNVAEQTNDSQDVSALSKRSEHEKQGETGFDLTNLVQNMVNQMSHTEENTKSNQGGLPISDDILQELALEITNQVQDQLEDESHKKSKTITDMPQIDENVLAHFQNEAYKDDTNDSDKLDTNKTSTEDNTLQAVLATAVRNAIESNTTTLNDPNRRLSLSQGTKQDNETEDLEQLQMNDILQNAFNMAMENPHDLLTNLEMEDENDEHQNKADAHSTTARSQSNQVATALAKLPHPLPASTTTFLESLNRSNDIDLSGPSSNRKKKSQNRLSNMSTSSEPISSQTDRISAVAKNIMSNFANKSLTLNSRDEAKKNSLSIAETLALHRSSMNSGPRRDYSSIESLDGALRSESSSSAINSQVSNVLSSLSSRINSAASNSGTDYNLLQVIRQMTSALTSRPSTSSSSYLLPTTTPSVTDIIMSYKDKKDESAIISPLVLAKKFLEDKQMAPSYGKAVSLIDNVLELFNSNSTSESQIDPSMRDTSFASSQLNLDIVKPEFITSISNSVASAISSFSLRSKKGSIFGERFKTDSPEYKERIRLENRERKKRWREENAERNKDNDLRSRVLKRATLMFGEKDTPDKKSWVDDEFNKRREKRIAKQKKDDYERQSKGYTDDDNFDRKSFRDKEPNALVHDPNLIRPVTDIFNIVSNFNHNEDPDAALAATSAATATAAAIYANTHNTTNSKLVESAVSKILLSLMENSHSVGQEERVASLSKGVTSSFKLETSPTSLSTTNKQTLPSKLPDSELTSLVKTTPTSTSGILNRLSATIRGFSPSTLSSLSNSDNAPSSLLQLQNLTLNNDKDDNLQKRKTSEPLPHDTKRSKPSSPLSEPKAFIEDTDAAESSSISNIASNLDSIRNAISNTNNSHLWSSSNALKMPHYKKPDVFSAISVNPNSNDDNIDPAIKKEYPTLSLASTSPFISNKSNYLAGSRSLSNSTIAETSIGLRKPGSFQRPSYSKPDKNKTQKGFGYPPLHSTSFKDN